MQKAKTYSSAWNIEDHINKEINDGWQIKELVTFKDNLIIIFEKETRKEKLEKLDDISSD